MKHTHLIFSPSAASSLMRYLNEERVSISYLDDYFTIGPLSSIENMEQFIKVRRSFYNTLFIDEFGQSKEDSLKEFIENIRLSNSFTLWLSPSAQDQIMWAWLTHVFEAFDKSWNNVQIKHWLADEKKPLQSKSIGNLAPNDFSLCKNFELSEQCLYELRDTYTSLINSQPNMLLELSERREFALPELQNSIKTYLKNYPDYKTGLNFFDRALLENCKEKSYSSAYTVGAALSTLQNENDLTIDDYYLFERLVNLSQLGSAKPLIELDEKNDFSMRGTSVSITDLGKQVLSGNQNQIQLNGIDEYIGGVHLSSEENKARWFYKEGSLVEI